MKLKSRKEQEKMSEQTSRLIGFTFESASSATATSWSSFTGYLETTSSKVVTVARSEASKMKLGTRAANF